MVLPIQTLLPHTAWAYIRVHRRLGTDKVLRPDEITAWAGRLADLTKSGKGPVFFLWGTDHEDQPIKNMANLEKAAGPLIFDWRTSIGGARRSLQAWFGGAPAGSKATFPKATGDEQLAAGPKATGDGLQAAGDGPSEDELQAAGLQAAASTATGNGSDIPAPPSASAAAASTGPPNPPAPPSASAAAASPGPSSAAKRATPSAPPSPASPAKRRPAPSSNAGSITSFFQRAAGPGPSSSAPP